MSSTEDIFSSDRIDNITSITTQKSGAGIFDISPPNGIPIIGEYAFCGNDELVAVRISGSAQMIGWRSFCRCPALTKVHFDDGVMAIAEEAFRGCESLAEVVFPPTLEKIGSNAFKGCTSIAEVIIPSSVLEISDGAFADCAGLITVTILGDRTHIADNAFMACEKLNLVYFRAQDKWVPPAEVGKISCEKADSIPPKRELFLEAEVGVPEPIVYPPRRKDDVFPSDEEYEELKEEMKLDMFWAADDDDDAFVDPGVRLSDIAEQEDHPIDYMDDSGDTGPDEDPYEYYCGDDEIV